MKRLILFDFDGTLTEKDTLLEFIKHVRGSRSFYLGFLILSPLLILYKFGFIKNSQMKQIVLSFFLGGMSVNKFNKECQTFASTVIPDFIRKEALDKLRYHKALGDEIYIVSASPENWVRYYADSISVKTIATQLIIENEKITGRLAGLNCYGPEKVRRIKEELNLNDYTSVIAYGDSHGDREMLALAHHSYFRKFY